MPRPEPDGKPGKPSPRHKTTGPEGPVRLWWQRLLGGLIKTPQQLHAESRAEAAVNDAQADHFKRFTMEYDDPIKAVLPQRLVMRSIMTSDAMLRRHGAANWSYVDPALMGWAAMFIEQARKRGIPLYVHSAFRTKAEQDALVAKRASRTPWPRAAHCQGKAVDIVHGELHWQMSNAEWAYLFDVAQEALRLFNSNRPKEKWLKLRWGGDWDSDGETEDERFYDPAHWEILGWQDHAILRLPEVEPVRHTPKALLARFGK